MIASDDNSINISKRALQRLADAQRQLGTEMRALSEHHSRFLGTLMACDANTQQAALAAYRDQLYSVHARLAKLRLMLEPHCESPGEPGN